MIQIRRFSGIYLLAGIAGSLLLLSTAGSSVVNAQRRLNDGDVFKAERQVSVPGTPVAAQQAQPGSRTPGGRPDGIVYRNEGNRTSPLLPNAGPISNCVPNGGPGHTCNIYETDAAGNPSDISNVITTTNPVVGGYLVLKRDGAIADNVISNWSDVLLFGDGSNATTSQIQLFSVGCNTSNPNDRSCFPVVNPVNAAFVVESSPGPTVYFSSPNTYNVFSLDESPVRPWSTAGSTGQHDEDSSGIVRYNSFGVNMVSAQTGSVHMRYNITSVEGIARLCPATFSTVRTRFRNSDPTGNTSRVTYEIHTSSIGAGGNTILYTFDSNGKGGGQAFRTVTETPAIDFNFSTNMYWIEATLFRSVASEFADLGTIQIWESAGTACP